ncbi:MAG: alanine--tRNA ligase [Myxococcota bacterium]|nr:alanine--tRNA ligase [Myxococcota bacterium]MEC9391284.1 alanine--tRNA ligase [Myxococcota bacterium]
MKSSEIRARFIDFFASEGHEPVSSSSLVPNNDPTLFFTNAGMVPFKDVFTGREVRGYNRAASSQKCLRVSGKHNDLENVGQTPRHHTFFEMLGNFSFGDYFKSDAIRYAWRFLTEELGISPDKLWVTVFEDDDEAAVLWEKEAGVAPDRIQRLGAKDNFWSMGETGPCGPCSEIFFDHGPEFGPSGGPATESDRYIEIWNLVFMQFDRSSDGTMTPLPKPSIDTGMGLERIAAVMQGVYSNYDTDCFSALMEAAADLADVTIGDDDEADTALRVIADHARATGFLIADGVMPSNEERGYVLRRVMRRAIRYGVKIGLNEPFLYKVVDTLVAEMGGTYSDLEQRADFIREVVRSEEDRFRETLDKGLHLLDRAFEALAAGGQLPGETAFKLHDTFGFPLDLTQLIASERGYSVDRDGYASAMEAQRAAGRAAWKGSGDQSISDVYHRIASQHSACAFVGYTLDEADGRVVALVQDGAEVSSIDAGGKGVLIANASPFYAEAGGQIGDRGSMAFDGGTLRVLDTQKPVDGIIAHSILVTSGTVAVDQDVSMTVDAERRNDIRLNHTATHLLHAALRDTLGDHVVQKGSLVAEDRLRFDFSHHKALTSEELRTIEARVCRDIMQNEAVQTDVCTMDDAVERGAMALFGEKYGDEVRVIDIPGLSVELCGGTHVARTGDIGLFRIASESSVAAGVRRIEACTGRFAVQTVQDQDAAVQDLAELLRSPIDQMADAIQRMMDDRKRLTNELSQLKRDLARQKSGDLTTQVREVNGIKVVAAEVDVDAKTLRTEADRVRDTIGSGVVVLGSRNGGAVKLVVTVSKDLAGSTVHAGNLIREIAGMVGGGGGGRPDMAQAGGRDPDALPAALEAVYSIVGA